MKAKDLAALAALGIAGKFAYDKYSEKNAPATKAKAADEDYSNEGRSAKFADEDYSNEGRSAKFANEDYSNEGRGRAAPDYSNEGRGKTAPVAVAKPVAKAVVEARSLDSVGGPSRYNRAADSNAAGSAYDATAPVAQRIAALNEANGAASESARQTDALANASRAAVMVDRANKLNPTAMRASGASTPSARATDALAVGSRANQAAYLAQQRAAQDKLDALRSSGGRRAKGGAIKMASGGLASSKMSKPSGASRGDGIAQRGRTRGKYL